MAKLAKAFRKGSICYHPDAPQRCRGKIIGSHTIQRSGPLRRIARDGHVYGYRILGVAEQDQLPKLIGVRDASTFPGFCSLHDTQLFAPVEVETVEPSPKAAFLLAYRAIAYELHQKNVSRAASEIISASDRGRSMRDQVFVQQIAADFSLGAELATNELEAQLGLRKADLGKTDYDRFQSIFIYFDRVLPFVSSFFVAPYDDFNGQKLQGWFDATAD